MGFYPECIAKMAGGKNVARMSLTAEKIQSPAENEEDIVAAKPARAAVRVFQILYSEIESVHSTATFAECYLKCRSRIVEQEERYTGKLFGTGGNDAGAKVLQSSSSVEDFVIVAAIGHVKLSKSGKLSKDAMICRVGNSNCGANLQKQGKRSESREQERCGMES